jgi:peptidoglycan-N-acetylglucosamine deacetylase
VSTDRRAFLRRCAQASGAGLAGATLSLGSYWEFYDRQWPWDESTFVKVPTSSLSSPASHGMGRVWWSAETTALSAALCFDDGPSSQFTLEVLGILRRESIIATFFLIGEQVLRRPDLARQIRDAGHEIGNHSFDHVRAGHSDSAATLEGVTRGADTIQSVLGQRPRWYRPPRGEITTAVMTSATQARQEIALWSVDRGPAADDDSASVSAHLKAAIHPGAIIDLHDGIGRSGFEGTPDPQLITRRAAEIAALPQVLAHWKDRGFTLKKMSDLIAPTSGPTA